VVEFSLPHGVLFLEKEILLHLGELSGCHLLSECHLAG